MAPGNLSNEEKPRIFAWRSENVITKEIVRRTGRSERTIRLVVSAAQELSPLRVPLRNLPLGGQGKHPRLLTSF